MRRDWQPDDVMAWLDAGRRGLAALFSTHLNTYGQFNLQMDRHLGMPQAVR